MTLREARCGFTNALGYLILHAKDIGLEVALDEVTDHVTEKDPTTDHMVGSLHEIGLAADLLVYKQGVYLTDSAAYGELGQYWELWGKAQSLPLAWGGRFTSPDGNHFSLEWKGKK